jgi:hypothetical protein
MPGTPSAAEFSTSTIMIQLDEKFGYYLVHFGNLVTKTCSKVEAIEIAERLNGWISWHFCDEEYSSHDWAVPVSTPIQDLYCARAQQIRNEYDHVIIMYSGGYDSHNMLSSFVDNHIKVDAVCSFYNSTDANPLSDINNEWTLQTYPRLQKIKQLHPWLDIIRLDVSQNSLRMIDLHADSYQYIGQGTFAPNFIGLSYLIDLLPRKYRTNRTCILFGVDKPRLRYHNNRFVFNFHDMGYRVKPVKNDTGMEYFYWSRQLPELVIKQAQIAKTVWEQNLDKISTHSGNKNNPDLGWVLDHDYVPVQQQVYPACANDIFLTWRPRSVPFGQRDTWIYHSNSESKHKLNQLYHSFKDSMSPRWFNQGQHDKGLISNISRDYFLT